MRIVHWDLETTDLSTDIGHLIVASFLEDEAPEDEMQTRSILDFRGNIETQERKLAEWCREQYSDADILIGYNSQAFDKNYLQGVSGRHGLGPLPKRFHIDMLLVARYGFKGHTQNYKLETLLDFFRVKQQKDKPSKHDWRGSRALEPDAVERIALRNRLDVIGQRELWRKMLPYWLLWKGQL